MSRGRIINTVAVLLGALIFGGGCAVKETAKRVIGTSTATLESQRRTGPSKTYYCSYQDCFDAILTLGRRKPSANPVVRDNLADPGVFDIFTSDLYANPPYIILMGVEGNIDTTEVGVFFERMTEETIRIDVSSLSSSAKHTAATIIFKHLENNFRSAE